MLATSAGPELIAGEPEEYAVEKIILLKQLARIERETGWKTSDRAAELRTLWNSCSGYSAGGLVPLGGESHHTTALRTKHMYIVVLLSLSNLKPFVKSITC